MGAGDYAAYGEMLVLGSEGVVTPAAREAFGNALRADASETVARFYLALADAQAGRGQQALDAWVKLAGEVSDADMRSEIDRHLARGPGGADMDQRQGGGHGARAKSLPPRHSTCRHSDFLPLRRVSRLRAFACCL